MPTETHRFPTPDPVRLHLRNGRGTVMIATGDGPDTIVAVSGRHDAHLAHVGVSDDGHTVTVDVPRQRRFGSPPRLDIAVQLPQGSTLDISTASASITTRGSVAQADVRSASGSISVEQVAGAVDAKSASGDIHLGRVEGDVRLKSASGDLHVATAGGSCSAATASGAIDIGWAGGDVTAKSASGAITVRDAVRGELGLHSTSGDVAVGVRKGTLTWLDLTTVSGRTISDLTPDGPASDSSEEMLTIRVRTVSGDITVAPSASAGARLDDRRQTA